MYIPVNPSFTIQKWGVSGSILHEHVNMMTFKAAILTTLRIKLIYCFERFSTRLVICFIACNAIIIKNIKWKAMFCHNQ